MDGVKGSWPAGNGGRHGMAYAFGVPALGMSCASNDFFFPLRVDGDWGVVEEGCGRENIDRA